MFIVACAGIGFNLIIAAVLGEHHVHGISEYWAVRAGPWQALGRS